MKNGKRILKVTVKHILDESPDLSWLGEYSNIPESEYSIDRAHTLDCASVTGKQTKETLEHAALTVADIQKPVSYDDNPDEWEALEDAYNLLDRLAQEVIECDCWKQGSMNSREFRYFNPCHENYSGEPTEEIRKYCLQDYERMEAYNNQQWYSMGIRAEAKISIIGDCADTIQTITSSGIWGIESDSDKPYIESEEENQLDELKGQLAALGFSKRAISNAFQNYRA